VRSRSALMIIAAGAALEGSACMSAPASSDLQPSAGFAPPAIRPLQRNPPGVGRLGFGKGFYPLEVGQKGDTWRWMGPSGEVRLRNAHARTTLSIVGRVPLEFTKQAPTIRISVNGHLLAAFVQAEREFSWRHTVAAEWLGPAPSVPLLIEADRTGRAPGDYRDLGVCVQDLIWDAE
jgi:hypothetical protein